MRVIVTGSRDGFNHRIIRRELLALKRLHGDDLVIVHGGARGVDAQARGIAVKYGIRDEPHPADWRGRGKIAGHERNRLMLELGAQQVLAFKRDFDFDMKQGGTENMVDIALDAGLDVLVFTGGDDHHTEVTPLARHQPRGL